jgi:hypothetical protein
MMSSKDNQDSRPSKENSEPKNPGRRQVLGVAVVAAAFTAGQVGSAEGQGKKKVSPRSKDTTPDRDGYAPVSKFHDLNPETAKILIDKKTKTHEYRLKVSAYAKRLRREMGLLDSEYMHVVRLEPRPGVLSTLKCPGDEGCCGCCCC